MRDPKFVTWLILLIILLTCMVWFEATRADGSPSQHGTTLEYVNPACLSLTDDGDMAIICPNDDELLMVFHNGNHSHDEFLKNTDAIESLLRQLDSALSVGEK